MLAPHRRHDRLVGNAAVGHQYAERRAGGDRAAFERRHLLRLAERPVVREIDAAGVGQHRHGDAALRFGMGRKSFQERHAGLAQRFRVRHHVRLGDGHEVFRIEHAADLDHVFHRPAPGLAHLPGQHGPLFVVQLHRPGALPSTGSDLTCQASRALQSYCSEYSASETGLPSGLTRRMRPLRRWRLRRSSQNIGRRKRMARSRRPGMPSPASAAT